MQKALFSLWELADRVSMINIAAREIPVVMVVCQGPALPAYSRLAECNYMVYRLAPCSHVEGEELSCSPAQAVTCYPALPDVLPILRPFPHVLK